MAVIKNIFCSGRVIAGAIAVVLALAPGEVAVAAPGGQNNEFVIRARQAILMDADTGAVLFKYNAEELVPPASMSKLMTLAVVFKALKTGQIKLTDEFTMSEHAWRTGGGPSGTSAMMVPLNTKTTVDELLKGVIIQSGNDAAIALGEGIAGTEENFAKLMEEEARRLGLKHSTFRNATGLYHPEHLMSVRELAQLARILIRDYPEYYPTFAQREYLYRKHRFINRNPLLPLNIGADGLKTGYIKEAGYGIVGSAKLDNRRLLLAINGLATQEERREEAKKLFEWGFKAFAEFKLYDSGEVVGRARVWGGDRMFIPLVGNGDVNVMLPRFPANQKLKGEIVYAGPLKAPIRKGDQVAMLRVTSSTEATNEVPLFAADDVPAVGPMRRGLDTLLYMATRWIP